MPAAPRRPSSSSPRARRAVRIAGVAALVTGVVAAVLLTVYVGNRALVAKAALQSAQARLVTFRAELGQPGAPSSAALAVRLRHDAAKAAAQVDDPVWSAFETLPVLGPNLRAFRQTADLTDRLVRDGVVPVATAADGISVDSLRPKGDGSTSSR
ncbi:hypothetical protein [Amnibacterium kyonggiense]